MDARRKNSQMNFHPLPNAEITDSRGFGGEILIDLVHLVTKRS